MAKKSRKKKRKHSAHKENYSKRILSALRKNPNKPLNHKQIAAHLGVKDKIGRAQIIKNLTELSDKSKIDPVKRGKYKLAGDPDYFDGVLDMTTRGKGYVIVEELEKDIYITHKKLNHALNGDEVRVYCYGNPHKRKPEGEIISVLKRKTKVFVGVLQLKDTFGFVEVNDPRMYTDIFVRRSHIKNAKDGEVVQVEIKDWPKQNDSPEGKIIKRLGEPGKHETEIQSILAEHERASDFPKEVEDFAESVETKIQAKDIKDRRDMRKELTFTIDPKDAKDFDDALSFRVLENGNYEISVHIADVSHYVTPDSILDEEAYERGTSIYLVDRTVPMLPEVLSNNVCSLWPNEDKLTFSAVFELSPEAQVINKWFGKTIIRSDARHSYEEIQHIIETEQNKIPEELSIKDSAYKVSNDLKTAVLALNNTAKILRSARMKKGAISFDKVEVKFDLDENKEPIGVYFETAKEANKLIEEFMLLTNKKVSEFVSKKNKKKTFIYRCHDEPNGEKLAALKNLVKQFGYSLNLKDKKTTSKSINSLLKDVDGKKEQNLVDTLAIRTMSKAYYSTENIGHYGLAFDYYSHFTAPIRRYSDILTHRLLHRYLQEKPSAAQDKYEEMCGKCSEAELYSIDAERDSIKYMQVKFMQQYKNESFLGVISGVTDFGIFVEIIENKCEGLVRIRDIKEDQFDYVEEQFAVIGRHSGKKYQLGDEIYVRVKKTDLVKRNLDFDLLGSKAEYKG